MRWLIPHTLVVLFVCAIAAPTARAAVLYQDDFEDGDAAVAASADELTWQVLQGDALVEEVDGSLRLGITQSSTFVVATQTIEAAMSTVTVDARTVWSEPGAMVFLYVDANNFYWVGLGNEPGVFRRLDGVDEQLYTDNHSLLRLPHTSGAEGTFKIFTNNTGAAITIAIDRSGDGVDYDVELTDDNSTAVARFVNTTIGAFTASGAGTSRWFHLDNIAIHDEKVVDTRVPVTYYVDAQNGDDSRTEAHAQSASTPWQTIQRAANVVMSGDEVVVFPGVYRESVSLTYSGQQGRPIVIRAQDPSDRPVLDGSLLFDAWTQETITDFQGGTHQVFRTEIDWLPPAVFLGAARMAASQHPSQSDPDDPYNLDEFLEVPAASNPGSSTDLVDPSFFTQSQDDYWVGATLLLYDGSPNTVAERAIVDYIPAEHRIVTEPFTSNTIGPDDRYAIRHHVGILDQAGEFFVDSSAAPQYLYVWPFAGQEASAVSASKLESGFNLAGTLTRYLIMDGFEIRFYTNDGVHVRSGSDHNTVRNCFSHQNMGDGVFARDVQGLTVEGCLLVDNHNDGIGFSAGSDYEVIDCEVTGNGNNGIWAGTGGGEHFNTERVTVTGSYVHHQAGRRMHPDNYQMHQCRDVLLDGNIFIQEGHQNMWVVYSDEFVLTNNIFMGGTLGINSSMHNQIFHNVFIASSLRYDQHLTNHPDYGDYYRPQEVQIRNNVIIDSGISWPDAAVLDRFEVYSIDHNYYNIENDYARSGWSWDGYKLGVLPENTLAITTSSFPTSSTELAVEARIVWSDPGHLVVGYKDSNNFYAIGVGGEPGVRRILAGTETLLDPDSDSLVCLPHLGGAEGTFTVLLTHDGSAIQIAIERLFNGVTTHLAVTDNDAAAVAAFAGDAAVGVWNTEPDAGNTWFYVDDVVISAGGNEATDDFDDGDETTADGASGLTWTTVSGGGLVVNALGGRGVGFGEGSIVETDPALLHDLFVQPPNADYSVYDLHPLESGVLVDAGVDVGVDRDMDQHLRPAGTAVDIGAYEFGSAPPTGGDSNTPASDGGPLEPSGNVRASCACRETAALWPMLLGLLGLGLNSHRRRR